MKINLTEVDIDQALPIIQPGLEKYIWIQKQVSQQSDTPLSERDNFRRKFNHFYRVRRGKDWQDKFYTLLDELSYKPVSFPQALDELRKSVNRYEASFASKLLATLNPQMPVIDSIVLRNLGCKLPSANNPDRLPAICALHQSMTVCYQDFLLSTQGTYLVDRFRAKYPEDAKVLTDIKMVDFVLWQTRP